MVKELLIVLRKELNSDGDKVEVLLKKNIMITTSLNKEWVENLYFCYFKDYFETFRISWISGKSIEKNILLLTLMFDEVNDNIASNLINKIEKIPNRIKPVQITLEKLDNEKKSDLEYFIINDPKNEFKNFEKQIHSENIKFIKKEPDYSPGTNGATSEWFILFTEQLLPSILSSLLTDLIISGVKNISINHGTYRKDYSLEAIDKISTVYGFSRESLNILSFEQSESITSVIVASKTGRKFKVSFPANGVTSYYEIKK